MQRLAAFLESKLAFILILIIGAALRLRYVGASLCIDDFVSLRESLHLFPDSVEKFRPVFFSLLYGWRCLGPDTDFWLQLLPFLLSFACVPVAWLIGRNLGGRGIGAALALLLAISPTHLDMSAELRMYGLLSLLGLLQLLCYLHYRQNPRTWLLVVNTLVGVTAMYTHVLYGLYLAGLFLLAILDRRQIRIRPYFASLVCIAILFLPSAALVLQFLQHHLSDPHYGTTHASSATLKLIAALSTGYTFFHVKDLGLGARFGVREMLDNLPLVLLAAAAFGLIVIGAIRRLRDPNERFTRHMIYSLLLFPIAVACGGVLIMKREFAHANYYITSLPIVLLFVMAGFQGWSAKRLWWLTTIALYTIVIGLAAYRFAFDTQDFGRRADWHHAARYIESHAKPNEPLLLFLEKPDREVEYPYLVRYGYQTHASWKRIAAPKDTIGTTAFAAYLRPQLAACGTVYYLWDPVVKDLLDPRNTVIKSMRLLAAEESVEIINPRLAVYRWKLREPTGAG
jgi:hypothetical protein